MITISCDGTLNGWTVVESGGSAAGHGTVTPAADGNLLIREGDSFLVSLEQNLTIPSNPGLFVFDYANLSFDQTNTNRRINDAFEVDLVDGQGQTVVQPVSPNRDAYFNATEGQAPALGKGTNLVNNMTVTTDISQLTPGSTVRVRFRLVNNDGDTNTSVEVGCHNNNGPPVITGLTVSAGATAATAINEGSSTTLSGTFTTPNPSYSNTVTISWGDGSANTTLNLAANVLTFSANHTYLDNPAGQATSGSFPVGVTVTDPVNSSGSGSTAVFVNNVVPGSPALTLTAGATAATALSEGGSTTLSGSFTDPGTLDTHTVVISWGDGSANTTLSLAANVLTFSASHAYLDNPNGQATGGSFPVGVTVTDKDGGVGSSGTAVFVNNVAPSTPVLSLSAGATAATAIGEGSPTTLSGTFTDPGLLDNHTVVINWGDGNSDTVTVAAPGASGSVTRTFSKTHIYADNPTGHPTGGSFPVGVTVTDKDGGSSTGSTAVFVNNVPPTVTPAADQTVARHQPLNFQVATFTDPGFNNPAGGTQETFAASINWGDGATGAGTVTVTQGSPGVLTRGTVSGTHTYSQAADYTVTVTVTDDDGGTGSATFRMHVLTHGATKFFVVDQPAHSDFTYDAYTNPVAVFPLSQPTNSRARGVASNATGTTQWVIDANKTVYVYNPDGSLRGSWDAGGINQPQDIATNGTDIWIIDNASDLVFHYAGAAARLSGSQNPDSSFALNAANRSPTGLVTDGSTFWVTDDQARDANVFVYSRSGTFLGSWLLDAADDTPSGITLNPQGGSDLWVVDRHTATVYHYAGAMARRSGSQAAADSFALAPGNDHPEGIADPPPALTLQTPANNSSVLAGTPVLVSGQVQPGSAAVSVNGVAADAIDAAGDFFSRQTAAPGQNVFRVAATDPSGQTATTSLTVTGRQPPAGKIDFALLADVTGSFTGVYGRTSFNAATLVVYADLAARNIGQFSVTTPLLVGVTHISDPNVRVRDNDGLTPTGIPFYNYTQLVNGRLINPGGQTGSRSLDFYDPNRVPFTYDLVFLAPVNHPPAFTSAPVVQTPAGQPYTYATSANDPDGDPVHFTLLTGPAGMTVDPVTGLVTWTATPASAGNQIVTLQVDDGRGGTAQQQFVLSVVTGLPNRPPVFTSVPVVDANVGTPYQYPATAVDPDGDPLTFSVVAGPQGLSINPSSGQVQWTPTASQLGVQSVTLKVDDGRGGTATQVYQILVQQQPNNPPPVIVSHPQPQFNLPGVAHPPLGAVQPAQINLTLGNGQVTTQPVSLALPNSGSLFTSVDVFLLLDDTGSFAQNRPLIISQFPTIMSRLQSAFPSIDFGFGIGGFKDYGGSAGAAIDQDTLDTRPFVLNQPIITPGTTGFSDAIGAALNRNSPGNGGDQPEASLEGLYQIATGSGFDGNNNGTTSDSGPAGLASTQTNPGTSGDVPAFSSFTADPANHVLPPAGRLGGVGFRPGALPVILVATDTGMAYQPDGIDPIHGVGGVTVPLSRLTSDVSRPRTPFNSGATFQRTVTALNQLGALVIGLGTGTNAALTPRSNLSALATLTGAVNQSTTPIDSGITGQPINPGDPFYFLIQSGNSQSIANGIVAAISSAATSVHFDIDVVASDAQGGFVNRTGVVTGVGAGQTATFTAQFTGNGAAHAYDLLFVRAGTGVVLGSLPVTINTGSYLYPARAIDPDGEALTWSLPVGPASASIDPQSGRLTWTPAVAGQYPFRVRVTDTGGGIDTQDFTVNVTVGAMNHNPVITSTDPTDAMVGQPYSYPVTAADPDGDLLSFFLTQSPAGMSIDQSTGVITWTPTAAQLGAQSVTVQVLDGRGGLATRTYVITVAAASFADRPPRILSTAPTTAVVGQPSRYYVAAFDPDGDPLQFDLPVHPTGMSVDPAFGVVIWTPGADQVGVQSVLLRVSDGRGGVDLQSYQVTVTRPDTPPTITSQPLGPAVVGSLYQYPVHAQDADGDPLTFALTTAPSGMAIDATGLLTWTPSATQVGSQHVVLTASDGRGGVATQAFDLPVVMPPVNHPPVITSQPPGPAVARSPYRYQVTATDPDGDPISFALTTPPAGMAIDAHTGLLTWTPTASQTGSQHVIVTANDGRGGVATQTFDLPVAATATNHPPTITSQPLGPAQLGSPYRYQVVATDPDGDPITFALSTAPSGMAIDARTGLLSWMPATGQTGSQHVVVTASDGRGGVATQTFDLPVVTTATNHPPTITSQPLGPAVVNLPYQYQVMAIDPDGDPITFALTSPPSGMGIDAHTGLLTWRPGTSQTGTQHVVVTASDGRSGVATQTFDLSVVTSATNHLPVITSQPLGPAVVGLPYQYQVMATDSDGDPISFALTTPPAGMAIDAHTGLLTWTPTASQTGSQHVIVTANDGRGGVATQTFDLPVAATATNHPPTITSQPPGPALVGSAYRYPVVATDPDSDPITFALTSAPTGMAIDARSGLLTWTPVAGQAGVQHVIITASDGRGGVTTQTFDLVVGTGGIDHPPVISSQPLGPAQVGSPYQYQVAATDPDGDPITFVLTTAPTGMTVDARSGLLTWTPVAAQVGSQHAVLLASDGRGGVATQTFDLLVVGGAVNHSPVISSTPSTTVQLGLSYLYPVVASDPDGDPLTFSLDTAPAGMTISAAGIITWQPTGAQVGSNSVQVRLADGRGGTAVQPFTVTVSTQAVNHPPSILSTPPQTATVGQSYVYNLQGTDPDSDPLVWSLPQAPTGMSIDSVQGTLRWTPTADQVGSQNVVVQLQDSHGATVTQSFTVSVRGVNVPPRITSSPGTSATAGTLYTYAVVATDINNNPLTFSLTAAPAGMTVDGSGVIRWTPSAGQAGNQNVTLRVDDGQGGVVTQTWTVVVTAAPAGQPPVITSTPPFVATVGSPYSYQIVATDPQQSTLHYVLVAGPAGMTIDAGTGLVQWTPSAAQVGAQTATVAAVNAGGLGSQQRYTVTASVYQAPTISSTSPPATIIAGLPYRYDLQINNPSGDPLTYRITSGPAGMTVDANGRVTWSPGIGDLGTKSITLTVTDAHGTTLTQSFMLVVQPDMVAPKVTVQFSANPAPIGSSETILVSASDNVGVQTLSLTVNGTAVALDMKGFATVPLPTVGQFPVVATAQDAAGNASTATATLTVIDPHVTGSPTVALSSPTDGAVVTAPTNVVGTVQDTNLLFYTLEVAPISGGPFTQFARGTTQQSNGVLGSFDPTLLANGTYTIRLTAQNTGGLVSSVSRTVSVAGNLKLGNFKLSFTDLSIPVSGIPITITRTYDTLNANSSQDFGFGWQIGFRDISLRVSFPDGAFPGYGQYPAFTDGTRVYVTVPGGQTEGFTFQTQVQSSFFGIITSYHPVFVPDPGVIDQLTVPDVSLCKDGNQYFTIEDTGLNSYNPADPVYGGTYTLRTLQRLSYSIDANNGKLLGMSDLNGNTLTFSDTGITSNSGRAVTFNRDPQGRIIAITDPRANSVKYGYDAQGNLVSVTDRAGDPPTTFQYNATQVHYLTSVVDGAGNKQFTVNFASDGRLSQMQDAAGNPLNYSYDLTNLKQTTTDPSNNATTTTSFDSRGNVTQLQGPAAEVTKATYQQDLPTAVTQVGPDGDHQTAFTYDASGNRLTSTDPTGAIIRSTYGPFGTVQTVSDPLGNTVRNQYDANGNLTRTTSAVGVTIDVGYDAHGNPTSITRGGAVIKMTYDAFGDLASRTDAAGVTTLYIYDADGNQTNTQMTWVNPANPADTRTLTTTKIYDANDRLTDVTDAQGKHTQTKYDSLGRPWRTIDPYGGNTDSLFDVRNLTVETTNPDGTVTRTVYDAEERATYVTDSFVPGGTNDPPHVSRTLYDGDGRTVGTERWANVFITRQQDATGNYSTKAVVADGRPFDPNNLGQYGNLPPNQQPVRLSVTSTVYSSLGQVSQTTDASGLVTQYTYDAAGRQTAVVQVLPNGHQIKSTTTYDAAGRAMATTDPLNHTTHSAYNGDGQTTQTTFTDGTTIRYSYDSNGRRTSASDQLGQTTNYEYDTQGRLTAVVQPAVMNPSTSQLVRPRTEYTYDNYGNRLTQKDALGRVTAFTYDPFGNETSRTLPQGQGDTSAPTERMTYDSFGKLLTHTDFVGNIVVYHYDPNLGRRTEADYFAAGHDPATAPPDQQVRTQYDPLGRVSQIIDSVYGTVTYGYDADGRMARLTTPEGEIDYGYDPATGRHTSTATANSGIQYGYDALGRLISVHLVKRGGADLVAAGVDETQSYTYDDAGNLVHAALSRGPSVVDTADYGYDALNQLQALVQKDAAGGPLASYTYQRLADGHIREVDESLSQPSGVPRTDTVKYTYDALGRLTEEALTSTDTTLNRTTDYTLDLVGNRLNEVITTPGQSETVAYAYDNRDRLLTETHSKNGGADQMTVYGYDVNGALTGRTNPDGSTVSYTFDLRGRMVQAQAKTSTGGILYVEQLSYGPDGIRTGSMLTQGGVTTTSRYLIDSENPTGYAQVLEELNSGGTLVASYMHGLTPISQTRGGQTNYYLLDGHSGVRQLLGVAGTVAAGYLYDAFGSLVTSAGSVTNPLLYRGEWFDPVVGQYYLRARFYDPAIGRFNRLDPFAGQLTNPQTLQKYVYAAGDPVDFSDPSGQIFIAPAIRRLIAAVGADLAIRILVGITATYVLGNAYKTEVNPSPNVDINRQIARLDDPGLLPDFIGPDGKLLAKFLLRPDILDKDLKTIYEIKTEGLVAVGKGEVLTYIAVLAIRYPGQIYRPGTWNPQQEFYSITGLPGLAGIPFLTIEAWNAGGGVIAYRIVPDPNWIVALATVTEAVRVAIPLIQTAVEFLAAPKPSIAFGF